MVVAVICGLDCHASLCLLVFLLIQHITLQNITDIIVITDIVEIEIIVEYGGRRRRRHSVHCN